MKAFMSTEGERHEPPFPEVACASCVDQAAEEVRAILMEAESVDSLSRFDVDHRTVVEIRRGAFVGGRGLWAAEKALAEALEAVLPELDRLAGFSEMCECGSCPECVPDEWDGNDGCDHACGECGRGLPSWQRDGSTCFECEQAMAHEAALDPEEARQDIIDAGGF